MVFKGEYIKLAPVPFGHYKFQIMAGTNNEGKTIINAHFVHNAL